MGCVGVRRPPANIVFILSVAAVAAIGLTVVVLNGRKLDNPARGLAAAAAVLGAVVFVMLHRLERDGRLEGAKAPRLWLGATAAFLGSIPLLHFFSRAVELSIVALLEGFFVAFLAYITYRYSTTSRAE